MIVIRDAQLEAMGRARAQEFELALARRFYVPSNRPGAPDEWDMREEVANAVKQARALGFESEAAVAIFVELRVQNPEAFASELAKRSTQALLADANLSSDVKISLFQRRVQPSARQPKTRQRP